MLVSSALSALATSAFSAEITYIHIQTEGSLRKAFDQLEKFTAFLPDVNGFFLGDGEYAIALGPYEKSEAQIFLRGMQSSGILSGESYLEKPARYGDRIWHMGLPLVHESISEARLMAPNDALSENISKEQPNATVEKNNALNHMLQNERSALKSSKPPVQNIARSQDEWREIQYALRWAGFYNGAIDGAFGGKTKEAIQKWQDTNGFYQTGSLTDVERDELFQQHTSLLFPLAMREIRDDKSGIAVKLPFGAVTFDSYSGPFMLFVGSGLIDNARIILISQEGGLEELNALFSQMQGLENIPANKSQVLNDNSFILTGESDLVEAYTYVRLYEGTIKGFSLLWPRGDERRRGQVLANMMSSLQSSLNSLAPIGAEFNISEFLNEGYFQEPTKSFSGFFVDEKGHVLTVDASVNDCERITFNGKYDAKVVARDPKVGLAVVAPTQNFTPNKFAKFRESLPQRIQNISLTSYSFDEIVPEASLTFGKQEGLSGLRSKLEFERVVTRRSERDIGSPILDEDGSVLGIMTVPDSVDIELSRDIGLITDLSIFKSLLKQAGVNYQVAQAGPLVSREEKLVNAREMTVMINCWN
jgi:peptidoglycan hydrolase-like protein with peptidoglycan-binding domain